MKSDVFCRRRSSTDRDDDAYVHYQPRSDRIIMDMPRHDVGEF